MATRREKNLVQRKTKRILLTPTGLLMENLVQRKTKRILLTPTGLLMEGFIARYLELKKREFWVLSYFDLARRSEQTTERRAEEDPELNL